MSNFSEKFTSYSTTELNELLEDDEKLQSIVKDMDEMQGVQQSKDTTLASNRTLAELNLALQPQLEQRKELLSQCYSCLQESFENFQLRKSSLDHSSGNTSMDTLLALLQAEGAKIEEETENMADSFLEGDVPLDSFMEGYQTNRKLAHLRRVKIEKLQEMLLSGQRLPRAPAPPQLTTPVEVSPMPQPRRKPPNPPLQQQPLPPLPPPAPPTATPPSSAPPPVFYSSSPYPPIPPRSSQQFPAVVPSGYPSHYLSQYPPALPQRPQDRLAPQPGFIMQ